MKATLQLRKTFQSDSSGKNLAIESNNFGDIFGKVFEDLFNRIKKDTFTDTKDTKYKSRKALSKIFMVNNRVENNTNTCSGSAREGSTFARRVNMSGRLESFEYTSYFAVGEKVLYSPEPFEYLEGYITCVMFTIEGSVLYGVKTKDGNEHADIISMRLRGNLPKFSRHILQMTGAMREELISELEVYLKIPRAIAVSFYQEVYEDFTQAVLTNDTDISVVPLEALAVFIKMISVRADTRHRALQTSGTN